jgi:ADP-ribose pyrophosphatase YjhB (NUDIX family)
MTTISYAVMYADDGTFLLGWKPVLGFYAGNGKSGNIWVGGHTLDGGANYALPGSPMGGGETIEAAAARGFTQQTGQQPPATRSIATQALSDACAAAYFRLADAAAVRDLDKACNTASLPNGARVATAVKTKVVKSYADIEAKAKKEGWLPWPYDDQLQETSCRNILAPETWNWVCTWREPASGLDAFYPVLAYLHDTLLASPQGAARSTPLRARLRDRI